MSREQILDTLVYIGTRLRNSISIEYFNNLMSTLYEHNDPKEALILFMVHVRMMEKWGTIRSSIANEIVNRLIEVYNNASDKEKYEILTFMRKYLPWVYESRPRMQYNNIHDFLFEK